MNIKIYIKILFLFLLPFATLAQNGKIEGIIKDKSNNLPVPFANIVIDGTTIGSISDFDGKFIFTGLEPGFIRLRVSFVGYSPTVSPEIQVSNSKKPFIEIDLEPANTEINEITVRVSPYEKTEESPNSLQKIGLSEIENSPGSNRDISKVIQSFPGVGSGAVSFRNDIIVRGGGPSENVFYFDDIEIPNINHFATQGASGGPVGIINADLLSEVNFFSGSFPANKPNALSSVFDFKLKEGNKEKQKFSGTLGASEVSLMTDGPIGEKTSYIFSVRRSYLQFLFNVIGLPFLPTFNDYQFKIKSRINEKNELKILSIGALDNFRLNLGLENPTESQQYILDYLPVNEQWSYAFGTVWKHFYKNSYQTFVFSRNMLDNVNYKYLGNDENNPKILDYTSQEIENKFRIENTARVKGYKINASVNFEYAKYKNDTKNSIFINNQVQQINYFTSFDMIKWGGSIQASKSYLNKRLSLSAGLRADANNYSSSMQNMFQQLSPRISLKYALTEKLNFNISYGKYFRLPQYTALGYKNDSDILINKQNNIKYISAVHFVGGLEYNYSDNVIFSIEVFNKNYSNYPFSVNDSISLATKGSDFGVLGNEEIISSGTGNAIGFELLNRTKIQNKLNLIAAYTFVRSRFDNITGDLIPTSWDSKHLFTLTSTLNLKNNWSVGTKWRYVGGLPYTPYDLNLSSNVQAWDIRGQAYLDYNQINSERLKAFHQLDLRVDKNFYFNKITLKLYVDVQNVYGKQPDLPVNIIRSQDANGNYLTEQNGNKYVLKELSSESGATVFPTIGIIVEF